MEGTYNGYTFKVIPTRPKHQHVIQLISPHIPTITLGIIALNLLQWHYKPWSSRLGDILSYISCLTLHNTTHPWLSLTLAISYTIWQALPGSFASLNLPSHEKFMRSLSPHENAEKEQDCMICWDDEKPLAILPCKHMACVSCLRLMGENLQTACPLCRTPLFSQYDMVMLAFSKATVCVTTLNILANVVLLAHFLQHGEWFQASLVLCFLGFVGWMGVKLPAAARAWGINWWRPSPQKVSLSLRTKAISFSLSLFTLVQTVWSNKKAFN